MSEVAAAAIPATVPATPSAPKPLALLDQARAALRAAGIPLPAERRQPATLGTGLRELMEVDESAVVPIARVLEAAPDFNEVVRGDIETMKVGQRYEKIARAFDSIREDGERMVKQLDDGKTNLTERLGNTWMRITRGTIASRFEGIQKEADAVFDDSQRQVDKTHAILDAYAQFRLGMKQAVALARGLLDKEDGRLEAAKQALSAAQAAVDAEKGQTAARASLEVERDRCMQACQDEQRRYQVAKNLEENLSNSHNVSDVVMARLNQTLQVHEQVLSQARTFMATNETVLTALNASFTSTQALHESATTLDTLRHGINQALESQADVGTRVQETALASAFGPGIRPESVKKLVDSIVAFQQRSFTLTETLRKQSAKASADIAEEVEDGRRRLAALAVSQASATLPAPAPSATDAKAE